MKKIYIPVIAAIFFALMVSGLESCKKGGFLNATSVTNLDETTVFPDSARTNAFLIDIYNAVGISANGNRFGNGGLDVASDESFEGNAVPSTATYWATGTINAANVTDDVFKTCYSRIRAVNVFLKNIHLTKLNLAPSQPGSREQLIAEARFLRAWYYAILVKHYGGVSLVGNTIFDYEQAIPVKRNTYDECVKYIVSQCDSASAVLSLLGPKQTGPFYGRASAGACQALKARVLLYAASPLFNLNSNPDNASSLPTPLSIASDNVKPLLGYTDGNQIQRWKLAKDAAYVLIRTGAYKLNVETASPGKGFGGLYSQRVNDEYIFQWMLSSSAYGSLLVNFWLPPSRGGNSGGGYPYQETVDAFPMRNGKSISDPTSGYNSNNPYANRDPRFNYSIIHDQSVLADRLSTSGSRSAISLYYIPVSGSLSAVNGDASATPTGYYTYKMIDTTATGTDGRHEPQGPQPLLAYPEMLLNYVEAMNEVDGVGKTDSIYAVLKLIRDRAGIIPGADGLYGLKAGMSQSEFRIAIQNERRIELAFEEQRFWDVRRWKTAPNEESKIMHGMRVVKDGATKTYTVFTLLPKHGFDTRMYLWPFPQAELGKSADLIQNPGY